MIILRWIIAALVVLGVVLFALAHPEHVKITWNPFAEPVELPLYFVVIAFLGIGFFIGAFVAWVNFLPVMADRRAQRKNIQKLEKDLNTANEKLIEELSKSRADTYASIPKDD